MKLSESKYPSGSDHSSMYRPSCSIETGASAAACGCSADHGMMLAPTTSARTIPMLSAGFLKGQGMRSIRTGKHYNSGTGNSVFGFNVKAFKRMASTSPSPFRIRMATAGDMDKLCELSAELLTQIRAEGTAKDARRVFERIIKSSDLGTVLV